MTVFLFFLLQVFDISCFNLGGSIKPPEPPRFALVGIILYMYFNYTCSISSHQGT